jgi:hypothetical protein
MNTETLLRKSHTEISNMTKADILKALEHKYSVTNTLDEKKNELEKHDKEMKEFRTLIETLASCLNIDLPRCSYRMTLEWNRISVPLLMGKMFAEIAKIEYDKTITKKED